MVSKCHLLIAALFKLESFNTSNKNENKTHGSGGVDKTHGKYRSITLMDILFNIISHLLTSYLHKLKLIK